MIFHPGRLLDTIFDIAEKSVLKALRLEDGTQLDGIFRFKRTDLMNGQIIKGEYTIVKVINAAGKPVGCPPLCDKNVRLALKMGQ